MLKFDVLSISLVLQAELSPKGLWVLVTNT